MPSPKPTCASCSVGMRSPRAEMVGMFVRISASTVTKPRSMATPTSSYPIPAETGPRPTATRNSSASIVLPPSRDTVTPDSGVTVSLEGGKTIEAELFLVAVGRGPVSAGIGYDEVGVAMERGFVTVDAEMRTNIPTISALGDLIPTLQLAHVGFGEGIFVAERLAGLNPPPLDYDGVPRVTYSEPEVASVGITSAQARDRGYDIC